METNLKRYFGRVIKQHIKKSEKIKQMDIAHLLGITPSAVSQMLSGRIMPKPAQLEDIMTLLKLDENECEELRECLTRIRSGEEELRSPINEFIKRARGDCGFSLETLSSLTGIPVETLDNLENRINAQPTPFEAVKLAAVFQCNVSDLWQMSLADSSSDTPSAAANTGNAPVRLCEPNTPYLAYSNGSIKIPVIRMESLLDFDNRYDHLVDFAWRHVVNFENCTEPGMVIAQAHGTAFGWSELYEVRFELCEAGQWIPGMTVLCLHDGELLIARACEKLMNFTVIGDSNETFECHVYWMIISFGFVSELFRVSNMSGRGRRISQINVIEQRKNNSKKQADISENEQ